MVNGARRSAGVPPAFEFQVSSFKFEVAALTRLPWARWWAVLALFFFAAAGPLAAQEVQVVADRVHVEAGEAVGLQVILHGVQNSQPPALPNMPGTRVKYLGPMTAMEIVNGQTSVRAVHRYLVAVDSTNDLVVPSFPVRVGNQTVQTTPLRVGVLPHEEHEGPAWLKLIVPGGTRVVGESFPVELQMYFQSARDVDAPRFNLDGFLLGRAERAVEGLTRRGNEAWSIVTWRFAVTATKTGILPVGPAEVDATLVSGRAPQGGNLIDEFFGPARGMKRVTLKSLASPVTVVAPPREGRPAGFAGAIGRFAMRAALSSRETTVGDPVTLRLSVGGRGSLERLELGAIADTADFRAYPGTNHFEPADALGSEGHKIFEYVLVPEQAGVLRVPVPPMAFYDPVAKEYGVASVPDLTLQVRGQTAAPAVPTVASGAGGDPSKAAVSGMPAWKSSRAGEPWAGAGWGMRPWVAAAAAGPWLAWGMVGAVGWANRRRRALGEKTPEQLRTAELARLRARLSGHDATVDDAVRSVRLALALRLGRVPDAIAADAARDAVARGAIDAALGDDVGAFLEAVDDSRFGGGKGREPIRLARAAAALVDRLSEVAR